MYKEDVDEVLMGRFYFWKSPGLALVGGGITGWVFLVPFPGRQAWV